MVAHLLVPNERHEEKEVVSSVPQKLIEWDSNFFIEAILSPKVAVEQIIWVYEITIFSVLRSNFLFSSYIQSWTFMQGPAEYKGVAEIRLIRIFATNTF